MQEEGICMSQATSSKEETELNLLKQSSPTMDAPSPSRSSDNVSLQSPSLTPIVLQPGSFSANLHLMDPGSQQVYNTIPGRHVTSEAVHRNINDAGQHLINTFAGQQASAQQGISYQNMVKSLILKGEQVKQFSGNVWALQYSSVIFCDEQNRPFQTKPPGIVLLTNKRFIFVSAQYNSSMSLTEFGNPKKLPGGYSVKCSYQDSTFYLPIPLHNFYSVELRGSSGMSGQIDITADPPCCGGMCLIFKSCCPRSTKQWAMGPIASNQFQELIIQTGVKLPPWGVRCFLAINLAPNVPVPLARDFVSLLQQTAPNLM